MSNIYITLYVYILGNIYNSNGVVCMVSYVYIKKLYTPNIFGVPPFKKKAHQLRIT
jgi:hypothetical protein